MGRISKNTDEPRSQILGSFILDVSHKPFRLVHFSQGDWFRRVPPPQLQGRPRSKLPLLGGTLTISIVEGISPNRTGPDLIPISRARVAARLQLKSKLKNARPSDEMEQFHFVVHWEPAKGALGIAIPSDESVLPPGALQVVSLFAFLNLNKG